MRKGATSSTPRIMLFVCIYLNSKFKIFTINICNSLFFIYCKNYGNFLYWFQVWIVRNKMTFQVLDYVIFIASLVISAAIGLYYRFTGGKQKSNEVSVEIIYF